MADAGAGVKERLSELVRTPGPWVSVVVDVSGDRSDPAGLAASRRRSVRDALGKEGAPDGLIDRIEDALLEPLGMPSPLTRCLLAHGDRIDFADAIPGTPPVEELAAYGPLPLLVPLLRQRRLEMCYLVVEAGRDAGDIALYRTGSVAAELTETVQGRTDSLPKVQMGGWSHLRWQHHSEEIWKQNETQLAAAVDALVLEHRPRLVVVSGDVRARQLLLDAFAPATRALVEELPVHTRADGASPTVLQEFVEQRIDALCAADLDSRLDRLRQEVGRGDSSGVTGVGWVVHALRQAQVETLFLDPDSLGDRTLLALDDVPWVATAPEDAAPAGIIAPVPAAEALARAAIITDADIRFVTASQLPGGGGAAALLRWPGTPS
ncbi:Vms1/Ankzf1 family peptidyl-tRNA hydrolase [Herbiconiux sp. L3-i23]|uniref:baeRF2 domain-containing protein n=1 Tax=Herbiconiux sp. L3-i23 TaxID=2905871 RepID=UPI00206A10F5|nr:Vms1/Ankzf1 family peptidyl-tRNA hydrolase [Herbiconiux sp. L3-i23]BDI22477.1 hypothetical protein L3i23_12530 [Herbiconiux sp. L3-i23]